MTQPTLINLHANKYSQGLRYYLFAVNLDRCLGSCNTLLNDLSNRACVPDKTKDLSMNAFNITTEINVSKILTKHISCKCECKLDSRKSVSDCKNPRNIICAKKIVF